MTPLLVDSGIVPRPEDERARNDVPLLEGLPGSARVWVFGLERELPAPAAADFLRALDGFLDGWNAHGSPLRSDRSLLYGRFLIVGVDDAATPPSGCSIDALVRELRSLAALAGTRFLGNEAVWYRDAHGDIRWTTRPAFRAEAQAGRVTAESIVFDNAVARLCDLRVGRWESPASRRWHATLLPQAPAPAGSAPSRIPKESGAGAP